MVDRSNGRPPGLGAGGRGMERAREVASLVPGLPWGCGWKLVRLSLPSSSAQPDLVEDLAQSAADLARRERRALRHSLIIFAVICTVFSILPLVNAFRHADGSKDYSLWYKVGQWVVQGQPLYPTQPGKPFPYMYPPFPAVAVFAPLSLLGYTATVLAMVVVNSLVWLGCILLSVYLVTGRVRGQNPLLYIVPAAVVVPYVWDTYFLGQINLSLLLMLLGAFAALKHRRQGLAGFLIALAAACKAFPILAVPYLVYRRCWRALASTLLSLIVLLVLLPAPFRGFERNLAELRTWTAGMVFKESGSTIAQRPGISFTYRNQSLLGLSHRLFRPVEAGDRSGKPFTVNVVDLGTRGAMTVFTLVALLLCGVYLLATRRPPAQSSQSAAAYEQSMLICLIVMFSPLAWTYYYCWLIFPFTAALAYIGRQPRCSRRRRIALIACGLSLAVLLSAITQSFDQTTQALGATVLGTIILYFTLAWMARSTSAAAQRPLVDCPQAQDAGAVGGRLGRG